MQNQQNTLVVQMSRQSIIVRGFALIMCGIVFLALAGVFLAVGFGDMPLLGKAALSLMALVIVALAGYCLLMLSALAVRIEVGPNHVRLRIPRMRGPLPLLGLVHAELPYEAIASVERREEIYISFGLVSVQTAFSIVTREGTRLLLGAMAPNWSPALPLDEAAGRIAAHIGHDVLDHGAVRIGGVIHAMIRDVPPWTAAPMPPQERQRWDRRATLSMQVLLGLLGIIAVLRACSPPDHQ